MRQVARLADKQLVLALVVALLGFGGQILAYTYVTPFPGGRQRLQPSTISLLLLGFGAAAAVGNFIAGPIADRWLGPALLGGLALLAAIGSDLDAGLIPITVPELLRLLRDTVIPPPRRDQPHRLHWSTWRRRHQHRARQAHQRWNAYAETTP